MSDEFTTIVTRYNESPEIIQQLIYYGSVTNTAEYIGSIFDLQEHQTTALGNEIAFLLLNLQSDQEFIASLKVNFEMDDDQVDIIVSIIERNLIEKIISATPELQTSEVGNNQTKTETVSSRIPVKAPAVFEGASLTAPAPAAVVSTPAPTAPAYNPNYEQVPTAPSTQPVAEPVYQSSQPAPIARPPLSPIPSYTPDASPTMPPPAPPAPDRPRWSTEI